MDRDSNIVAIPMTSEVNGENTTTSSPPNVWKQILSGFKQFLDFWVLPNRGKQRNTSSAEDENLSGDNRERAPPYKKDLHYPIFILAISALQVILYYADRETEWWLALCYDPRRRHEIWRFLSMMFAHNSHVHLWRNIGLQLVLGILLEVAQNSARVAIIYLTSVLGGTLFITVLSPTVYGVGASGAVYGLFLAHLATLVLYWNIISFNIFRLLGFLAYFGWDIGSNVYIEFMSNEKSKTSHSAHIGGAITGFLTAIIVLKSFENRPWEKNCKIICATTMIVLALGIIVTNISIPSFYYPSHFDTDYLKSVKIHLYQTILDGTADSEVSTFCQNDPECSEGLQRYNQTRTSD